MKEVKGGQRGEREEREGREGGRDISDTVRQLSDGAEGGRVIGINEEKKNERGAESSSDIDDLCADCTVPSVVTVCLKELSVRLLFLPPLPPLFSSFVSSPTPISVWGVGCAWQNSAFWRQKESEISTDGLGKITKNIQKGNSLS